MKSTKAELTEIESSGGYQGAGGAKCGDIGYKIQMLDN